MPFPTYQELDKRDLVKHLWPFIQKGRVVCRYSDGKFAALTGVNHPNDPHDDGVVIENLMDLEFLKRVEQLLDNNCIADQGKFRIILKADPRPPWLFVKHDAEHMCFLDRQIIFERFGIIPPRCLNCWKVVVAPRTLWEVDKIHDIMEWMDHPSKIGYESRKWTNRIYGGYFYNKSKEEGLDTLDRARELIHTYVAADVPIYLKRACTEMELSCGPTTEWNDELDENNQTWVDYIEDKFVVHVEKRVPQPDFVKVKVIKDMIEWAFQWGDPTVDLYTDEGRDLVTPSVKYERGDDNENV